MSEMVERVARALGRHQVSTMAAAAPPSDIDRHIDQNWQAWVPMARAAITAMREPTDAMMVTHNAYDVWPKMIDAALAPSTEDKR